MREEGRFPVSPTVRTNSVMGNPGRRNGHRSALHDVFDTKSSCEKRAGDRPRDHGGLKA